MAKQRDDELKVANLQDVVLEMSRRMDHQTRWPFVGTSMLPHIEEGDILWVQHALNSIRLGDVIVFRRAGGLVAHRVVLIRRHGDRSVYRTKGDNVRFFDATVPQSSVLGRVVRIQKPDELLDLEKPHVKFLNFVLALSSYGSGVLHRIRRGVLQYA